MPGHGCGIGVSCGYTETGAFRMVELMGGAVKRRRRKGPLAHLRETGVRNTITTQMKHSQQQKAVSALVTRRAVSEKTNGEQTSKGPTELISFEEMVSRVNAFFDGLADAFKQAMKPYGMEIGNVSIHWRPADLRLRETLSAARLVPEVKVVVSKEGQNELPN